jgi:hypothetical protein
MIFLGSCITTKHGNVNTDFILFIASGAFSQSKPSDLLAELQVSILCLSYDDFLHIYMYITYIFIMHIYLNILCICLYNHVCISIFCIRLNPLISLLSYRYDFMPFMRLSCIRIYIYICSHYLYIFRYFMHMSV